METETATESTGGTNFVKEHTSLVPKVGKYAALVNKDSTVAYGYESSDVVYESKADPSPEVVAVGGTLTTRLPK